MFTLLTVLVCFHFGSEDRRLVPLATGVPSIKEWSMMGAFHNERLLSNMLSMCNGNTILVASVGMAKNGSKNVKPRRSTTCVF